MSGYTTCPKCKGDGIIASPFCPPCDIAHTRNCDLCAGIGEVRADVAVDYIESQVSSA